MTVTRFAPSPTGLLHLGHAFAAWFASAAARKERGRFLLRIENIDLSRCTAAFEDAIFTDLAWLDLTWEKPVRRQSEHFAAYAAALARLRAAGILYPCFCTRRQIADEISQSGAAPHGMEGPIYPGTCRTLTETERARRIEAGESFALRLDAARAALLAGPLTFEERGEGPRGETGRITVQPELFGDIVVARRDIPASYHLAVVVDDAAQGVTLVTRGNDLFHATHIHRLLQALLELPEPAYAHHRLILDGEGRKFSKRNTSITLRSLRDSGVTPAEIGGRVGLDAV